MSNRAEIYQKVKPILKNIVPLILEIIELEKPITSLDDEDAKWVFERIKENPDFKLLPRWFQDEFAANYEDDFNPDDICKDGNIN